MNMDCYKICCHAILKRKRVTYMIETERLILRPVYETDLADIYDYAKDEAVGPHAGWKPHENIEESEEIACAFFYEKEDAFAIVEKNFMCMIGTIGLVEDPHRANDEVRMLGYAMGRLYWGEGFMAEAAKAVLEYGFMYKKYPLISVSHYDFNTRSKRVIEKCGFHFEGILRRGAKRYDGEVFDMWCYSLTKDEYEN